MGIAWRFDRHRSGDRPTGTEERPTGVVAVKKPRDRRRQRATTR
jgi:hypothetical protein